MNRDEAVGLLRGGPEAVKKWNRRREEGEVVPDLSGVDLTEVDLSHANLCGVRLTGATLRSANLSFAYLLNADLSSAKLEHANFANAILREVKFTNAVLRGADLRGTNLYKANLTNANMQGAELQLAALVRANLQYADLSNCTVYGISAWQVELQGATQSNLIISRPSEPMITVDNLEVAQFIYLLLHNEKIRDVINTITSKVVLILGRFTPERKAVLDAIREELRHHDYCPVLFDFETPATRDTHETVTTLAGLARLVVADITEPTSIPQELVSIVQSLPSLPVQPLLEQGKRPWGMFGHIQRYRSVLPVYRYEDAGALIRALPTDVIAPAEAKAEELLGSME